MSAGEMNAKVEKEAAQLNRCSGAKAYDYWLPGTACAVRVCSSAKAMEPRAIADDAAQNGSGHHMIYAKRQRNRNLHDMVIRMFGEPPSVFSLERLPSERNAGLAQRSHVFVERALAHPSAVTKLC
jgi:hypothetical protein